MEARSLPEWAGGYQQPLKLADAVDVITRLAELCIALARQVIPMAAERQLVTLEFSRWLGVAVGQLLSVFPSPRPELLETPSTVGVLDCLRARTAREQLDALVEVLSALATDRGWGNRNLAFTARQLHADLLWWREESNLWAVLP